MKPIAKKSPDVRHARGAGRRVRPGAAPRSAPRRRGRGRPRAAARDPGRGGGDAGARPLRGLGPVHRPHPAHRAGAGRAGAGRRTCSPSCARPRRICWTPGAGRPRRRASARPKRRWAGPAADRERARAELRFAQSDLKRAERPGQAGDRLPARRSRWRSSRSRPGSETLKAAEFEIQVAQSELAAARAGLLEAGQGGGGGALRGALARGRRGAAPPARERDGRARGRAADGGGRPGATWRSSPTCSRPTRRGSVRVSRWRSSSGEGARRWPAACGGSSPPAS